VSFEDSAASTSRSPLAAGSELDAAAVTDASPAGEVRPAFWSSPSAAVTAAPNDALSTLHVPDAAIRRWPRDPGAVRPFVNRSEPVSVCEAPDLAILPLACAELRQRPTEAVCSSTIWRQPQVGKGT